MTISKDDFNHLIELYNRRLKFDVIGIPYEEQVALGRAIDALRNETVKAWAIQSDGLFFSLWLTEKAAQTVLASYQRNSKMRSEVIPIEVTRIPDAVGGEKQS